ncbi:hypothetical protein ACTI_66020 [Actinoplanes sp. OR16]|nr:hypothetical protein ACTI_66020 [Actinoplanes sp. OR16]
MADQLQMARRRGRTSLAAATAIALIWLLGVPPAPAAADPATLDQIEKAAGVDEIPADYVIMADTSSSMRSGDRYNGLRTSLRAFFAALSPADQVTLITFDDGARVVYQGQVGRAPDTLVGKLPASANGKATDIGAALEKATEALARPGAPALASVVLVTDGRHEPPSGSPYPLTEGYGWQQLRKQVERMDKQSLRAYALPLSGATGASLLGSVFDRPTRLNASSIGEVTRLLQTPKDESRKAKVRSALAGEQGKGIAVTWPAEVTRLSPGDNEVTLTVRSTTSVIPQDLVDMEVASENPAIRVRLGSTAISVPPGGTATVPAVITWDAGPHSLGYSDTVDVDAPLRLSGTASSPWTATLADELGIGFQPGLGGVDVTGHGSANLGRPWLYYLTLALAALLLALVLRGLYLRPSLYGVLAVTAPGGARSRISLSGRGRRATLSRSETGENHAIRTRVVRQGRAKRLRVDVDGATMILSPDGRRTHRSVQFEWLDGSQPAHPAGPQRPQHSALRRPSAPPSGATTQWLSSPQPGPAKPAPNGPSPTPPAQSPPPQSPSAQSRPSQSRPSQSRPTQGPPTQGPPAQNWAPPSPAGSMGQPPSSSPQAPPVSPVVPTARQQPGHPVSATPPPSAVDPDGDDELPVIDTDIARIE